MEDKIQDQVQDDTHGESHRKNKDKVRSFDARFTTNQIQKLKILSSYFGKPMEKNMAVYIKLMELQYTLQYDPDTGYHSPSAASSDNAAFKIGDLCEEFLPYCDPKERTVMEQMKYLLHTMDQLKEMMEMAEMLKEMFPQTQDPLNTAPDAGTDGTAPDTSFFTSLFGMPDLSFLSQMMQMMQSNPMFEQTDPLQGGDNSDGNN